MNSLGWWSVWRQPRWLGGEGRQGRRESVQELELDCFSLKPAGLRMSRVRVVCFCHSKTAFGRHTEKKVDVAFALGSFLLILRL